MSAMSSVDALIRAAGTYAAPPDPEPENLMTIDELLANNAALVVDRERVAAENRRLRDALAEARDYSTALEQQVQALETRVSQLMRAAGESLSSDSPAPLSRTQAERAHSDHSAA